MPYLSTRGRAPVLPFDEVLLAGLAPDGGLYVPSQWPQLAPADLRALAGLSYAELAVRVMLPFLDGTIAEADFASMVAEAYRGFGHEAVAPLVQLGRNDWLLELFHGPTLSFKDYALQLVGRLFDHVLKKKGRRATIVVATSGDTGSAAIEACRGRQAVEIVVLHPKGRVSDVQRRQMTTVVAPNVHNVAVEGSFDDCQAIVKALFNDAPFRERSHLAAMNSINWARIMAQTVYYVAAAAALGAPERAVSFAVPTGNFGNVYAAFGARRMGLPIAQLVVGSNANDILTRFFETGEMRKGAVVATLSPSMDIQISSNFERYLHDLHDGSAAQVGALMEEFQTSGRFAVDAGHMERARALFAGFRLADDKVLAAMKSLYETTGQLIDPHSAIGVEAGRARRRDPAIPMIAAATAHPAKFPAAVESATGVVPALPNRMKDLMTLPERYETLPCDIAAVRSHIEEIVGVAA